MNHKSWTLLCGIAISHVVVPPAPAQTAPEESGWHSARTRENGVSCMVWDEPPQEGAVPWWLGNCANGKAAGDGALVWVLGESTIQVLRGKFVDGQPHGVINVQSKGDLDFTTDITFKSGVPLERTVKYTSGVWLSGPVDHVGRFNGTVIRSLSSFGDRYKEWYSNGLRIYSDYDKVLNIEKIDRLEIIDEYVLVAYKNGSAFGEIQLSFYCPKLKKGKLFKMVAYKDEIRPLDTIVVNGKACGYASFKLYP